MGIKNLNKLIKRNPIKKEIAENLIIDGYNLIITFIQSILASTREDAVGFNILEIFDFIVDSIAYRIKTLIDKSVKAYSCNYVYFVIDGLCQKSLLMDSGDVIDIKAYEHEKRESQLNKQKTRLLESIEGGCLDSDEKEAEKERRFFEIGDNYRYLIYPIIDKVYKIFSKDSSKNESKDNSNSDSSKDNSNSESVEFLLIESIYEADYTIANLAISLESVIIMSLDTDFYVMCCDCQRVFIMNFKEQYQLYSPYNEWKNILEDCSIKFNRRLIYRLAPLFGNDYTATETDKQYLLSAEDENCLKMIILRDEEVPKRKKKLYQLKNLIEYSSEIITLDELDDAIQKFSLENEKYKDYYEKYIKSVYAYEHIDSYFEYKDYIPRNNGREKIEKLFPNPRCFITDEFADLL